MTDYRKADELGRELFYNDFRNQYIFDFTSGVTDRVDFYLTATTNPERTYVGDIKAYRNEEHPRRFDTYPNYMIDYDKLEVITDIAHKENRIPLLVAYFAECTVIWDLDRSNWKNTGQMRMVNKDGMDYGKEKELAKVAYLRKNEAVYYRLNDNQK